MESKVFDVEAAGLTLQFEFYTFNSIQDDLKKFLEIKSNNTICQFIKNGAKFVKTRMERLNFLLILNSLLKKIQIKHMVLLAEKLIIIVQIFH